MDVAAEMARLCAMQRDMSKEYGVGPGWGGGPGAGLRWYAAASSSDRAPPGPTYVCHTCYNSGHWKQDCPFRPVARARAGRADHVNKLVPEYSAPYAFGGRFRFWYRARNARGADAWHQCANVYGPDMTAAEAKCAIATMQSQGHAGSWEQFSYGHVDMRLFEHDNEAAGELTSVRSNMRVVVHRFPVHRPDRHLEGGPRHGPGASAPGGGGIRKARPPPAAVPDYLQPSEAELERTLGFLTRRDPSAKAPPLAITNGTGLIASST